MLVDRLEDYYQNEVVWAVADAARARGAGLRIFVGGILGSPDRSARQRNAVFDLVGPGGVDGLLVLSGTLGNAVGTEALGEFCERFAPLPLVSVAIELPGQASVLADNHAGMAQAVRHLVEEHGARRLAFVRGPTTNDDAEQRYQGYCQVLAEEGIPLDPQLVVEGDFEIGSGRRAVREIYEERGLEPEAFVCASDDMAMGVLEALAERQLAVPEDVALVSFDDDEQVRFCTPELTTVRQPIHEQGRAATEMLLDMIEGGARGERRTVATELVVRESCGCPGARARWQEADRQGRDELFARARDAEREQARRRFQAEAWARHMADVGEALIASFGRDSLAAAVAEQFPRLDIGSCYVALYDDPGAPETTSRLALAYREGAAIPGEPGASFDSRALVPDGALPGDARAYVVEPLFFEREQLGYALIEVGPHEGNIYEALRDQISAAVKGAGLIDQVVDKERQRRRLVRHILSVTPDMHRIRPQGELAENVLDQLVSLVAEPEQGNGERHAFLALLDEESELRCSAAVGRFAVEGDPLGRIGEEQAAEIQRGMARGEITMAGGAIAIPLRVGDLTLGVAYIEALPEAPADRDLLRVLANQATVALQNIRLYEMATLDPLTGVHARRFFDSWIVREIRVAYRSGQPLSLMMIDMDDMKSINDGAGHLAGDRALAAVGRVLRAATRSHDIVGRFGGDEFAVLLPGTAERGAAWVGERIHKLLSEEDVPGPDGACPLAVSIGTSELLPSELSADGRRSAVSGAYFQGMAQALIQNADEALYAAKRAGRNRLVSGSPTNWAPPTAT